MALFTFGAPPLPQVVDADDNPDITFQNLQIVDNQQQQVAAGGYAVGAAGGYAVGAAGGAVLLVELLVVLVVLSLTSSWLIITTLIITVRHG